MDVGTDHRRIAAVLDALNAEVLHANVCLLSGNTAIVLRCGGYRESIDIHFVVCKGEGYRRLRQMLTGPNGIRAITRPDHTLSQAREMRTDQYGIRTMLMVDGVGIKFEVSLESRISLGLPGPDDRVCGVATLTPLDMVASKLLANSDHWRDDAKTSCDLIDLAMMAPPKALLNEAMAKAQGAYGEGVAADLAIAVDDLHARPHRLEQCMQAMSMTTVSKTALWARIEALVC